MPGLKNLHCPKSDAPTCQFQVTAESDEYSKKDAVRVVVGQLWKQILALKKEEIVVYVDKITKVELTQEAVLRECRARKVSSDDPDISMILEEMFTKETRTVGIFTKEDRRNIFNELRPDMARPKLNRNKLLAEAAMGSESALRILVRQGLLDMSERNVRRVLENVRKTTRTDSIPALTGDPVTDSSGGRKLSDEEEEWENDKRVFGNEED